MASKPRTRTLVIACLLSLLIAAPLAVYINNYFFLKRISEEMTAAVLDRLNDPEAGKIRNLELRHQRGTVIGRLDCCLASSLKGGLKNVYELFIYNKGELSLCGEINGKNSFGAYVGYRRFIVQTYANKEKQQYEYKTFIENNNENTVDLMCAISQLQIVYKN
jgi:hypothetical protein